MRLIVMATRVVSAIFFCSGMRIVAQSDVHLLFEQLQKMQQLFYDPVHNFHKYYVSVWIKKIDLVQTSLKAA